MNKIAWLLLVPVIFTGCGITQEAQKVYNLSRCEFRIYSVENVRLAGVNIQGANSLKNLGITDVTRLMAAAAGPSLPLTFTLNIDGKNPNTSPAGLSRLEYIIFIDDIQMNSGIMQNAFTIPPNNGVTRIPLDLNIDLKKVLQGKSLDAIVNFGFNLAGVGNRPTRIMVKLKPSIMVGSQMISYPGYINVKTEFTGL